MSKIGTIVTSGAAGVLIGIGAMLMDSACTKPGPSPSTEPTQTANPTWPLNDRTGRIERVDTGWATCHVLVTNTGGPVSIHCQ